MKFFSYICKSPTSSCNLPLYIDLIASTKKGKKKKQNFKTLLLSFLSVLHHKPGFNLYDIIILFVVLKVTFCYTYLKQGCPRGSQIYIKHCAIFHSKLQHAPSSHVFPGVLKMLFDFKCAAKQDNCSSIGLITEAVDYVLFVEILILSLKVFSRLSHDD